MFLPMKNVFALPDGPVLAAKHLCVLRTVMIVVNVILAM